MSWRISEEKTGTLIYLVGILSCLFMPSTCGEIEFGYHCFKFIASIFHANDIRGAT